MNNPFKNLGHPNLICAFSLRHFRNMSLRYGDTEESLNNRQVFLLSLGINYKNLVCAKQVHGNKVRFVTENQIGSGALNYETALDDTDALITDRRGLPLAIFTADCLPIFLYDPKTPAIGIVHAGWRSSKENIIAETIQLMQEKFLTKISSLTLAFGPAIRDCCYEVGIEFSEYFSFGLSKRNSNYYFDLAEVNKREAVNLGVREENIFDLKFCTSCLRHDFFSYRREGLSTARMLSVIMLR
ncbi:MAG: peptidoglycan editing factor PgeF [Candidatus Omnitrophota bacterium]|nr:peptidoglycan editing factor PgeF [Candidatus Omnitrophota bacterium]